MLFADTWSRVVKYKCLREEIRAFPQPSPTTSNQRVNKYVGEKTHNVLLTGLRFSIETKAEKSILGTNHSQLTDA